MYLKVNGKYINVIDLVKSKRPCKKCGHVGGLKFDYCENNNSVQVRCSECGDFKGCAVSEPKTVSD